MQKRDAVERLYESRESKLPARILSLALLVGSVIAVALPASADQVKSRETGGASDRVLILDLIGADSAGQANTVFSLDLVAKVRRDEGATCNLASLKSSLQEALRNQGQVDTLSTKIKELETAQSQADDTSGTGGLGEGTTPTTTAPQENPKITETREERTKVIDKLGANRTNILTQAEACIEVTSERWISLEGDILTIYVFYDLAQGNPDLEIDEQVRRTVLASDLTKLIKLGASLASATGLEGTGLLVRKYSLTKKRANLTITTSQGEATAKADLITGPMEHLFLSADLPVNKVSQLELNDDNQLVPKDEPTTFYVGVDFKIGDLLTDDLPLWQNLVVKLQAKASRHPDESWGVALGLRGDYLQRFGLDLDQFSPFVGWTFTREDAKEGDRPDKGGSRNSEFRVGLSFNLDEAMKWIGGDEE